VGFTSIKELIDIICIDCVLLKKAVQSRVEANPTNLQFNIYIYHSSQKYSSIQYQRNYNTIYITFYNAIYVTII